LISQDKEQSDFSAEHIRRQSSAVRSQSKKKKQATLLVVLAVIFFIGGSLGIQVDDDAAPAINVNLIRKVRLI